MVMDFLDLNKQSDDGDKAWGPLNLILIAVFFAGLMASFAVFYSPADAQDEDTIFLPTFTATEITTGEKIASADWDLPVVVNFWASWCTACRYEHPILLDLQRRGITLYGVNNLDKREDALAWLADFSNPFNKVIGDPNGKLGDAMDIYGLPETLLLDGEGRVVVRHRGTLTYSIWLEKFASPWQDVARN